MPGIRLHHPTLRNCVVALESVRPYKQPFQCPLCGRTHLFKTVHLTLDDSGDVIVSKHAFEKDIKDVPGLPFTIENEVTKPPPMILTLNGQRYEAQVHDVPFEGRR